MSGTLVDGAVVAPPGGTVVDVVVDRAAGCVVVDDDVESARVESKAAGAVVVGAAPPPQAATTLAAVTTAAATRTRDRLCPIRPSSRRPPQSARGSVRDSPAVAVCPGLLTVGWYPPGRNAGELISHSRQASVAWAKRAGASRSDGAMPARGSPGTAVLGAPRTRPSGATPKTRRCSCRNR